jgi:hypothetical protein
MRSLTPTPCTAQDRRALSLSLQPACIDIALSWIFRPSLWASAHLASSQVRPAHVGSVWFYILVQVAKTLRARVQTRRMVAADSGRRPPTVALARPAYALIALCAPGHYTWRGTCTPLYESYSRRAHCKRADEGWHDTTVVHISYDP